MSFIRKILLWIEGRSSKIVLPMFKDVTWTDANRDELNKFMETKTGKMLLENLNAKLYFAQQQAIVPHGTMGGSSPVEASDRLSIVYGMQRLFMEFVELYAVREIEKPFELDNFQLNEILNNRINGNIFEEVTL